MRIKSNENSIKIDNVSYPKGMYRVERFPDFVRMSSIYDLSFIDIFPKSTTIDNEPSGNVINLEKFLIEKGFSNGGDSGAGAIKEFGNFDISSEGAKFNIQVEGFGFFTVTNSTGSIARLDFTKTPTGLTSILYTSIAGDSIRQKNISNAVSNGVVTELDSTIYLDGRDLITIRYRTAEGRLVSMGLSLEGGGSICTFWREFVN